MPLPLPLKKKIQNFWLAYLGLILFLFFLVSQSVRSILLSYQIQRIENEIQMEQEKKSELGLQRNRLIHLAHIEEIAKKELGLVLPERGNVIVIPLHSTQQALLTKRQK